MDTKPPTTDPGETSPESIASTSGDHESVSIGCRPVGGHAMAGRQLAALIGALEGNPRFDRLIECRQELAKLAGLDFHEHSRIAEILEELHAAFEYCESLEFALLPELEGLFKLSFRSAGTAPLNDK